MLLELTEAERDLYYRLIRQLEQLRLARDQAETELYAQLHRLSMEHPELVAKAHGSILGLIEARGYASRTGYETYAAGMKVQPAPAQSAKEPFFQRQDEITAEIPVEAIESQRQLCASAKPQPEPIHKPWQPRQRKPTRWLVWSTEAIELGNLIDELDERR